MNLNDKLRSGHALKCIVACLVALPCVVTAADTESSKADGGFSYGKKGFQYESADGADFLWFGVRLQSRYSNSEVDRDDEPGLPSEHSTETKINRGRLKLGGHLFSPSFAVYSEYDFTKDQLLDLRVTFEFAEWLSIRAGQWKSEFNRERIDSSGAQQYVYPVFRSGRRAASGI